MSSSLPNVESRRLKTLGLLGVCVLVVLGLLAPTWADEGGAASPGKPGEPAADTSTDVDDADTDQPEDGPKLVAVSFNNAEMSQIAQFFMRELGKPVILHEKIQGTKITILAENEMPLKEAFEVIGNALRQKGVMMLEGRKQIEFLPIAEARRVSRRVVPAGQSVTELEDQSQIVDKVFELKHYDVVKLKDVILPMLPDYAFIVADPNINRLIVTDAAANLSRIEQLVERLDVPRADQTIEKIIQVEHGDASEIVSMVRMIIAGQFGDQAKEVFSGGSGEEKNGEERVVFIERSNSPIVLQADIARNWIMAVASPQVMDQIDHWVKELDKPKQRDDPFDLINITHADTEELARQITETLQAIPDQDVRNSVRVIPFIKSRQILVYGSRRARDMVQSLVEQLDVEASSHQVMKEITLKYDSAESVKQKIEDLFGREDSSSRPWWYGGRQTQARDVKVTADKQRNSVTVLTDPIKMRRIEQLIAEQWDRPIDLEAVQPKVYLLKYTDPVQVKTLLENMFTRSRSRTTFSWWSNSIDSESNDPVGRLFGQFSFEALRGSDKLIVSSKSAANYQVIDELIAEIDRPQAAGLPIVIELKHANAEDLAEQLNAMFSEPGTPAQITRTQRGLSPELRRSSTSDSDGGGQQNQQNQGGDQQGQAGNAMAFWWSQARRNLDEQPTSNLIGKPRFVPVNRRNALMILAPTAQVEPLRELIEGLDKPGAQVVLHAIITEVQHDDESTLGIRIASDPSILSDSRLADQSVRGGFSSDYSRSIFGGNGVLDANLDLNLLLQLLIKNVNLKILNEPRVYTADNQEAHFFDGQDVPVVISDQTSRDSADTFNRNFDFRSVGTRLHVRPHITQEGDVDLEINLELSRIVTGTNVFGNFIFDRRETTTHVTVEDGQTVIVSGIVRQEDFNEVRKLPLLGDIPLVGGAFRSTDKGVRNREVIAFITPHIVNLRSKKAKDISEKNRQWLERIRGAVETEGAEGYQGELYTTPEDRDMQETPDAQTQPDGWDTPDPHDSPSDTE